jgi:hypothetical protein
MNGYFNVQANLDYAAERQASLESAARHRRLVRELKSARRNGLDPRTVRDPGAGLSCAADLG